MIRAEVNISEQIIRSIFDEIDHAFLLHDSTDYSQEILVHEYRKIIKRVRALLRLIIPGIDEKTYVGLDSLLGRTGNSITHQRESTVNLRSFLLLEEFSNEKLPETLKSSALDLLTREFKIAYNNDQGMLKNKLAGIVFQLKSIKDKLERISLFEYSSEQFINCLKKSYAKTMQLYHDSIHTSETEVIHKWRKLSKYLLFQLKYSPVELMNAGKLIDDLDSITDILGKDHDLAVLENFITQNIDLTTEESNAFHKVIDNTRLKLQKNAFVIGKSIFTKPVDSYLNDAAFA